MFTSAIRLAGCLALAALVGSGVALAQVKADSTAKPSFRDERRWSPGKPGEQQDAVPATSSAAAAAAPPVAKPALSLPAADPRLRKLGDAPCGAPSIRTTALDGGRMSIAIASACRGGQPIAWTYGGGEFAARFEANGQAEITVDCFAGTSSEIEVKLGDGTHYALPVEARDLDKVSKIAVIWRSPAMLQLHAFEYAAIRGEPGHISSAAPSSFSDARETVDKGTRGRGFLSSVAARETAADKLEVYTFVHKDGQSLGLVTTAIDHATRGDAPRDQTCEKGALAEVPFRIVTLQRKGTPARESGVVGAAACGQLLADAQRFNTAGLPVLRIRQ